MRFRTVGLASLALAVGLIGIVALPLPRKVAFCTGFLMPWDVNDNHVVYVPKSEHRAYNLAFLGFARRQGLMPASDEMTLREVGGKEEWYLSFNSTACDGSVLIWSHNVAHPDEFVVTFYSNWLLGKGKTAPTQRAFLAEFGARYRIRPEREVNRERGF